jgi:hypothetical protein
MSTPKHARDMSPAEYADAKRAVLTGAATVAAPPPTKPVPEMTPEEYAAARRSLLRGDR